MNEIIFENEHFNMISWARAKKKHTHTTEMSKTKEMETKNWNKSSKCVSGDN